MSQSEHKSTGERAATAASLQLIQGKWRLRILCQLVNGPARLSQMRRSIRGISKKVLVENLRQMEIAGLIIRSDLSTNVKHVEYALSEDLKPAIHRVVDAIVELKSVQQQLYATE